MTIVCATDFSAGATMAARAAVGLARRVGDSVTLVHVVEPPSFIYPEFPMGLHAVELALRDSATEAMAKLTAELGATGVVIDKRILFGYADREVVDFARQVHARLIAMGTHGRRGPARFFIGSVAEWTIRAASCPVLVVREPASALEQPPDRPLRLMVGLDESSATEAAIDWVRTTRASMACDVTFVHVYWPVRERGRFGLPDGQSLAGVDLEVARALERDLRTRLGEPSGNGRFELRLRPTLGTEADPLALEAEVERPDLVVVGTHQRRGFDRLTHGSTAIATVRATTAPVLCVPEQARAAPHEAIPEFRSVLVPTDFSDLGNSAVTQAYALLRRTGGRVELCHVHEPALVPVHPYTAAAVLTADERAGIEKRLRALIPTEADNLGIVTHLSVLEGTSAAEAIVQTARRVGADVVALASHGRSGLGRALLGSVAETVVRNAGRPVLVIHPVAS